MRQFSLITLISLLGLAPISLAGTPWPALDIHDSGATVRLQREPASAKRRPLQLVARVDNGGTDEEPAFGFTLHEGTLAPPKPPYVPGPTILLKRGEPVSITVINQMTEATAVHWHGIELESPGGAAKDATAVIAPGGSFDARLTPSRAGTFLYHGLVDEVRQQRAGLTGALVVVDDPAAFDRDHDIVLLVSMPRKKADEARALVNGTATPPARELRAGQRYRLRFINAHPGRPSLRMRLLRGSAPLVWRGLTRGGADLPGNQGREGPSEVEIGNGETYDVEFLPTTAGDLKLDIIADKGTLLTSIPIRVR